MMLTQGVRPPSGQFVVNGCEEIALVLCETQSPASSVPRQRTRQGHERQIPTRPRYASSPVTLRGCAAAVPNNNTSVVLALSCRRFDAADVTNARLGVGRICTRLGQFTVSRTLHVDRGQVEALSMLKATSILPGVSVECW